MLLIIASRFRPVGTALALCSVHWLLTKQQRPARKSSRLSIHSWLDPYFAFRRYRLAGLPGEYQQRNITSPDINYCLISELIIWTQYEIQVAAYTGAGLGDFSQPVSEYTLQGGETFQPPSLTSLE